MLAQKLNFTSIPLKKYKIDREPIIFLGWLFANNIQGYKKVKYNANIKCTIAVGMTPTAKQNNSEIIKINNVNEKFFYLQGGDIFLNGGNCVKEENLSEIVEYLTI